MTRSVTTSHRTSVTGQADCAVTKTSEQTKSFHCAARSKLFASAALAALVALSALPAWTAEEHHTVVPAEDLAWNPGPATLLSGAELAVLFGSPAKAGPFVIRLKFPAGYEVPAHWHSKKEHVTLIAGTFGMATGDVLDRDAAPLLAPGSFVRIPARMPHFVWTDQETVVQINGIGPFDITYVSPEDDPRTN